MTFSLSAFGHIVGDDVENIERSIVSDFQDLIDKYRPHFGGGTYSGQEITHSFEAGASDEVAGQVPTSAGGTATEAPAAAGSVTTAPGTPAVPTGAAENVSTNPPPAPNADNPGEAANPTGQAPASGY